MIRVGMLTTVSDRCGIAAYSRELGAALREFVDLTVEPIVIGRQAPEHYAAQAARLNALDVVHIQHEHSFWGSIRPGGSGFWVVRRLIERPVVVTAHIPGALAELLGITTDPRVGHRWAKRIYLLARRRYERSVDIDPYTTGPCIVHTERARRGLIERGGDPELTLLAPSRARHRACLRGRTRRPRPARRRQVGFAPEGR